MKFDCPELPLDSFDYERAAIVMRIDTKDLWNWREKQIGHGFTLIGKADGSKIPIRAKSNQTVLMLEEDETGDRVWFHVPYLYEE